MTIQVKPYTSIVPELKTLWWPLWESTGATNGSTSPSGFATQTGETGTTRTESLTLTVTAGTVTWTPGVGFSPQSTANAHLDRVPSGDAEIAFFDALFDFSSYEVGQTLLAAFDFTLPSGWTAGQGTTSACLFYVGNSDVAGFGIESSSTQILRPQVRAQGSAAGGSRPVLPGSFTLADGRRTVIIQMECTAANTFKYRVCSSMDAVAPTLTAWGDPDDISTGGTAAPNVPSGTGVRITARRLTSSADRWLRRGATLHNVWFAGSDIPVADGLLTQALGEMLVWRGMLPRVLRSYRGQDAPDYGLSPDGVADATFSPITLTDMFVNIDGSRAIADHPKFSVVTEPKTLGTDVMAASDLWQTETGTEGLYRISTPPGGYKFARTESTPGTALKPVFLFSAASVDQSNRNRCEAGWTNNPAALLPRGERIWQGMRFWHDFDFSDSSDNQQHVAITQWYHRAVNSGLQPVMVCTLYGDRFSVTLNWSDVEGMEKADSIKTTYTFPGLTADMRGRWVDLVITGETSWDAADNPWLEFYVDDTLLVRHEGPNLYKGPTWNELTPVEEIRVGNYPGSSMDTPTPRDFYVRRFFVCRNTQGYTLAQIRAALQG